MNNTPWYETNLKIVAEISANHNNSLETFTATIKAAKRSGASAIKLQTYTAETMTLPKGALNYKIDGGLWDGIDLYDLYDEASTPYAWHKIAARICDEIGMGWFSTPFDESAVDFLVELGCPVLKIASFEVTDLELIRYASNTGLPIILSSGMASFEQLEQAVNAISSGKTNNLTILHCVSGYPTQPKDFNLHRMLQIKEKFGCKVGISDHTLTSTVSIAAVALGAEFVEKHFILTKELETPDSEFSLDEHEFSTLTRDIETVSCALKPSNSNLEEGSKKFRRSLYFASNLKAGDTITSRDVLRRRPFLGLCASEFQNVIGKVVKHDVEIYKPIHKDDFEG